jgi:PAS domain S-box-containing protein
MKAITHPLTPRRFAAAILCILALPLIHFVSRSNYNLFHGFADGASIIISASTFAIIWNSRHRVNNDYFLFTGIAFLFFAFLDAMHVLGNKNMGVFPAYGNLGPTFYIASRYLLSVSLLCAPLFIHQRVKAPVVLGAYTLVCALVVLSVFYWKVFPICIVEGVGLTPFKVVSDYIICLILAGSIVLLLRHRESFDPRVLRIIVSSIVLSIAAGLTFTLYTDPFGITNMMGHLFQLASFYMVYIAFIETSLTKPHEILFRELKQNEEKLIQNLRKLDDANMVLNQEITERKQAQLELERMRNLLAEGEKIAQMGTFEYIADTETTVWSDQEYRIYGLDPAGPSPAYEVMLRVCIHPDYADQLHKTFVAAMQDHSIYEFEHSIVRPDGSVRWVHDRAHPYFDENGKLIRYIGATLDITERKAAEEALRESEAKYRRLFENIQEMVTVYEVQRNERGQIAERWLREANPAFLRAAGVSSIDEMMGKTSSEVFGKSWSEDYLAAVQHAMDTGEVCVQEVHRPESDRYYNTIIVPLDKSTYLGTGWDITELKRAEESLRRTVQRFNNILSNIFAGILVISEDNHIEFANPTFCDQFNFDEAPSDLVGMTAAEMLQKVSPAYADSSVTLARIKCILSMQQRVLDEEVLMHDGRVLLRDYLPIFVDGEPSGRMWQHRDITERKRMEEELCKSRDELELRVQERTAELQVSNKALMEYAAKLERLNEELRDFAFIAAHDLQEPLRKIQTFGHMLVGEFQENLGEKGQDYLIRMVRSAERMSDLLRSLLDYSRIASHPSPFEPVSLTELANNAASDLELVIRKSGATVEIGDLPVIDADAAQIRQLLQNLLANSMKYCKDCEKPVVRIYCNKSETLCTIYVEDNGIGFDEKFIDRIFRPFQRLHGRGEGYEGTGMGLAICRKIVERHQGSITAKSTPGHGATFIVQIPVKQRD